MKLFKLIILLGLALLLTFYFFADPALSPFMPKCLFHSVTGYLCPGCGAQRMLHALLHARFAEAWQANPFLLCTLPIIPIGIWADLKPGWQRRLFYHPATLYSISAAIIIWGIARNL